VILEKHPSRKITGRCAMKKRDGRDIGADSTQGLEYPILKRLCGSVLPETAL
jgi:hypothetical protein